MKLFDAIHPDLFTVLACPNKELYAEALTVLYKAFQDNLKINQTAYHSMLCNNLEEQLQEATFEGEDIDEVELKNVQGKARFLIRKFNSRGWLKKEFDENFVEYIIVPSYSFRLLELFNAFTDDNPMRGHSHVLGTYSILKTSDIEGSADDKITALYSAYDHTQVLIKILKTIYHNTKNYFEKMCPVQDINTALEEHFDDFSTKVVEAYIRPLKIRDSIPKFRTPIKAILNSWLDDTSLLEAMTEAAHNDRRQTTREACRGDIFNKIYWIKNQYDNIESEYLDEIDHQHRKYTRATTNKIKSLASRDQSTRGNLNIILAALSTKEKADEVVEMMQPVFRLYKQSFLSSKSLWFKKHPTKREKKSAVIMDRSPPSHETLNEMKALLVSSYSKSAVLKFMEEAFGPEQIIYSSNIRLTEDRDYVMTILAVLNSEDSNSFYRIDFLEGNHRDGPYQFPAIKFSRREIK